MKISHDLWNAPGFRPSRHRGFSLLSTLFLAALIMLVAVGLLSLSTVTLRTANQGEDLSVARANARLAMMLALGELQRTLGPDTRVTAPPLNAAAAPVLPWLAVYDTLQPDTEMPLIGRQANGGALREWTTDARATMSSWRDNQRLGWLVSQAGAAELTPDAPGSDLVTLATFSSAAGAAESAEAPRVSVRNDPQRVGGSYAYWIADESQKARLDQVDGRETRQPALTAGDGMYALVTSQRADASGTSGYEWHKEISTAIASRIPSTETFAILGSDREAVRSASRDFTVHSFGVLSDPVTGGLKVDLGAYLDDSSTKVSIDLLEAGRGVIADEVSFVPGSRYALTGASFGNLRGWKQLTAGSGSQFDPTRVTVEPRFPTNRRVTRSADEVMEGSITDVANSSRLTVLKPNGNTEFGTPMHPIMADARFSVDFVYDLPPSGDAVLAPVMYPRVKLWNPYNVTLSAANYLVVMPFRTTGLTLKLTGQGEDITVNLNDLLNDAGLPGSLRYFVFSIPGAAFGPGECRVFMPDLDRADNGALPANGASPFALRYSASNVAFNQLTSSANNTPNGGFYLETTRRIPRAFLEGNPSIAVTTAQQMFSVEGWFLKAAVSSLSTSTSDILSSSSAAARYPSLQSVYTGGRGTVSYTGNVDEWEYMWDEAGTLPLRAATASELQGNVLAPRYWARHLRLLYLDEQPTRFLDAGSSSGQRTADDTWYSVALASDWNPRANIHVRFPTALNASWYWRMRHPWILPVERETHSILAAGTAVRNGEYAASPFWSESASGRGTGHFVLYDTQPEELPLVSLARLRHAALSCFGWQPTYPIGHSRAPFYSETDQTIAKIVGDRSALQQWDSLHFDASATSSSMSDIVGSSIVTSRNENLLYDLSYEANRALFDRYFLSGLPRDSNGRSTWDGKQALPNSRLRYRFQGPPTETLNTQENEALKTASLFLQAGSFNVNSTSVNAWKAVLSGLSRVQRPTLDGNAASRHPYSRTHVPIVADGPGNPYDQATFAGLPEISDEDVAELAEAIVDEVKARGPFLSLADFINRRLEPSSDHAKHGPLEAAIANTSLNEAVTRGMEQNLSKLSVRAYGAAANVEVDYTQMAPYRTSGMPGHLTQGDLLEPLAPLLTVRGDTFTIRAYGDARSSSGVVTARVWCEAVVQRLPEYLEHRSAEGTQGNEPHEPYLKEEWSQKSGTNRSNNADYATGSYVLNSDLTAINRLFGRRLHIASFRWLAAEEEGSPL